MKAILKYLFLLSICSPLILNAQVEKASLIGAYTYNFAKYTFWPNEDLNEHFKIVIISDNEDVISEFESFAKNRKIKDKIIDLEVFHTLPDHVGADVRMIVLTNEQFDIFYKINQMIEERPVLLISENFNEQRNVMINLLNTSEEKLIFEVNKANIISHNLKIDPEILLLGGTEIDIAELYRVSQQSMDTQQKEMNILNDSLSVLNTNFAQLQIQMERMQESINEQKKFLKDQEKELVKGQNKIISQSKELFDQQEQIEQKKELLEKQKESIHEQLVELSEQQLFIDRQLAEIKETEVVLDSLKGEINDKNFVLSKQSDIIYRQKVMVIMAVIIGLLSLIMLVSLISSYRNKTKKNRILTQQKIQIEKANLKLETTVKKLYDTITKLHETQTQLVASEKMASLGVLTAGIAHEINNPVNFIYTGINSLKNDYNDLLPLLDTIQECSSETDNAFLKNKILDLKNNMDYEEILEIIPQTIEDIHIGAERTTDIIRGLRNFSRIDKDNIQEYNVHEGIDSALLLLQNKFKNHIKIEKNYSQLPKIECYPGKLNQVFLNIISNAIDSIDKEGLIVIRTCLNHDKINIEIEDNGKGISTQNINNIFDPFFTTKNVGKGVGLGLSITFGIIKDHKGFVEVKSTENVGTVFSISLPCVLNN